MIPNRLKIFQLYLFFLVVAIFYKCIRIKFWTGQRFRGRDTYFEPLDMMEENHADEY